VFAAGIGATASALELTFAPPEGSRWAVEEIVVGSVNSGGGVTETSGTVRGTLQIIRRTATGFDATWTTDSIEASGQTLTAQDAPASLLIGRPFNLLLDDIGTPIGMRDWETVRGDLLDTLELNFPDDAARAATRRLIESWSPELAAQLFFKNLAAISICHGVALNAGESVEAQGHVPNGLGGPPILATERLQLVSVHNDAGTARLQYSRTLDPDSAAASLRVATENIARETNRPISEVTAQFGDGRMELTNTVSCEVDLRTGMTRAALVESISRVGANERRELREIRLQAR
jgi:hypothetical protein